MKTLTKLLLPAVALLLWAAPAMGQSEEWQMIHKGNKAFRAGSYETAGSYYKKAEQINAANTRTIYNLANVSMALRSSEKALKLYDTAAQNEKNSQVRAMARHNQGFLCQTLAGAAQEPGTKQNLLKEAINYYKEALRENPASEPSRYNLALCQKQLKDSPPQPQQQQQSAVPLVNYARQAEQLTRRKLNQGQAQRSLDKNW